VKIEDVGPQIVAMDAGLGRRDDGRSLRTGSGQFSLPVGREAVVVVRAATEIMDLGVVIGLATLVAA